MAPLGATVAVARTGAGGMFAAAAAGGGGDAGAGLGFGADLLAGTFSPKLETS